MCNLICTNAKRHLIIEVSKHNDKGKVSYLGFRTGISGGGSMASTGAFRFWAQDTAPLCQGWIRCCIHISSS